MPGAVWRSSRPSPVLWPGGSTRGGWRGASAGKGPGGLWRAGSRLPRLVAEEVPETLPPAWEKARVHAAGGPGEPGSVRGQQEGSGERKGTLGGIGQRRAPEAGCRGQHDARPVTPGRWGRAELGRACLLVSERLPRSMCTAGRGCLWSRSVCRQCRGRGLSVPPSPSPRTRLPGEQEEDTVRPCERRPQGSTAATRPGQRVPPPARTPPALCGIRTGGSGESQPGHTVHASAEPTKTCVLVRGSSQFAIYLGFNPNGLRTKTNTL